MNDGSPVLPLCQYPSRCQLFQRRKVVFFNDDDANFGQEIVFFRVEFSDFHQRQIAWEKLNSVG